MLAHLVRGVNLSHWFQHGEPMEPEVYQLDEVDWLRLRSLRLRHVRVLADPVFFLGDRGLTRPEALGELKAMIDAAMAKDLLVIVALQLPPELKKRLATGGPDRVALAGIWRTLVAALGDYAPERLLLEPLNEPELADAAASRQLLVFLLTELRALLPRHTLVASGHHYAEPAALAALEPFADRNVIYGFHFYEPYNFTHQGATWGAPAWQKLRNFPYPSSPRAAASVKDSVDSESRELLAAYGRERWNRDKVTAEIDRAAQWGKRHGLPVWCSEFGVLRERVKPDHRRAWLRDVRQALEARGIPWTHWDYAGPFGLVTGPRGQRETDALALEALGLPGPPDLTLDRDLRTLPPTKP